METIGPELGEINESSVVSTIRQMILESRKTIEDEFSVPGHDWLACFITRLTVIRSEVELGKDQLPQAIFDKLTERINNLTDKVQTSRRKLGKKKFENNDIDGNIKNELFTELEAITEDL